MQLVNYSIFKKYLKDFYYYTAFEHYLERLMQLIE